MSEAYERIIDDIEDTVDASDYCEAHDCYRLNRDTTEFADAAVHICERVRKAVAGNPYEWYVIDANGNKLHIGDRALINDDHVDEIFMLGEKVVSTETNGFYYADQCERHAPDTLEDIIADLATSLRFVAGNDPDNARRIAEAYADRFMRLKDEKLYSMGKR